MVFIGRIDDFDGCAVRKRTDADLYETRAFTTSGGFPHVVCDEEMAVSFRPSMVEKMAFIERAAREGKKLKITVEVA